MSLFLIVQTMSFIAVSDFLCLCKQQSGDDEDHVNNDFHYNTFSNCFLHFVSVINKGFQ